MNAFSGIAHTARHTMKACNALSRQPDPKGGAAPKAGPVIGVKSKQGIPTRTWGWITSFLWRREYRKQCTSGRVRRKPRAVSVRWVLESVPQGLGGPASAGFSWNGPWKPRELHHNSIFPDLAGSMNPRSWKHSRGTSSGMCCSNILTYNAEGGGREPAQSVGGDFPSQHENKLLLRRAADA